MRNFPPLNTQRSQTFHGQNYNRTLFALKTDLSFSLFRQGGVLIGDGHHDTCARGFYWGKFAILRKRPEVKKTSEKILNAPMICTQLVRYSMHVHFGIRYMPSYYPQNIALKVSWELN